MVSNRSIPFTTTLIRRYNIEASASSHELLGGLKVLELANVLAGPSCAQFLAELGATVIKIENKRTKGDVTRTWKLPVEKDKPEEESDMSAYFHCSNLGKKSVAVDISRTEGLRLVHDLAANSDVVIASYKPGDAEKLGVDYETLKTLNRGIVYAQITGYGLDDARAGYDAAIQAEAGYQYMNGTAGERELPVKMPLAMMDILTAHQLKEGVLAGLLHRERTGGSESSFVHVSLFKAAVSALANQATSYLLEGVVPKRMGSDHPSICPYGSVFTCGDGGQVVFAVGNDKEFANLCQVLDMDELAGDERFRTNVARVANRGECLTRLRKAVVKETSRDGFIGRLNRSKVPAAGVNSMDNVFRDSRARALVARDSKTGKSCGLRQVAFESTAHREVKNLARPPRYGEHTRDILVGVLGRSESDVEDLEAKGVVFSRTE